MWGTFNENAAYLSVGASERMAAPEKFVAGEIRAYQPDVADRAAKVGAFGRALRQAGVTVYGVADGRAGAVLWDGESKITFPIYRDKRPVSPDFFIDVIDAKMVASGDANTYLRYLRDDPVFRSRTTYIAAPFTPGIRGGDPYRRLGFLVVTGPGVKPGTLLTSPTTRTPGLVANVDIAPTITALYGAAIPGAAGRPVRTLSNHDVRGTLGALDRQTDAAARATTPVLAGYGIFAGLSCLLALFALRGASKGWQRAARFLLLTAAAVLPALLAVGVIAPQTPLLYGATLAAFAIGVAAVAYFAAPRLGTNPLSVLFYSLVLTVIGDAFLHTRLVETSLLSASTLTGIRFYGMGNEWFGLLLGAALACVAPWWLGIVVVCAVGLPYFGADAGGTLAATTAFAVLFFARRKAGWKRRHYAAAFALAVAVTVAFALLDRLQPGSARSHIGAAVATGETSSGLAALTGMVARKIAMNGSLLLSPWTLITVIALVGIGAGLRRLVREGLPDTSELRYAVVPATASGAIVAFLFNDGGVAAGILILVPVIVRFLDALLADKIESA